MKKISYFNPLNDINSETSKKSYKQIMKDHNCANVSCNCCCFKNSPKKGKFSECLVNTLSSIKRSDYEIESAFAIITNDFDLALDYYKYFYMKEIKQEEFDI